MSLQEEKGFCGLVFEHWCARVKNLDIFIKQADYQCKQNGFQRIVELKQ